MQTNKSSFLFYETWLHAFSLLPDEGKGRLFTAIAEYALHQTEPFLPEPTEEMAFAVIRPILDLDREKWEKTREARSRAGKASAAARQSADNHPYQEDDWNIC